MPQHQATEGGRPQGATASAAANCTLVESPLHPNCVRPEPTTFPEFFVVGEQKTGTSTLFHLLSQRPEIVQPYQGFNPQRFGMYEFKEPHYWSLKVTAQSSTGCVVEGECAKVRPMAIMTDRPFCPAADRLVPFAPAEYTRAYQHLRRVAAEQGVAHPIAGDYSATMLTCACCSKAVAYFAPRARVIALLRHPIHRTVSQLVEGYTFRVMNDKRLRAQPVPGIEARMKQVHADMALQLKKECAAA